MKLVHGQGEKQIEKKRMTNKNGSPHYGKYKNRNKQKTLISVNLFTISSVFRIEYV